MAFTGEADLQVLIRFSIHSLVLLFSPYILVIGEAVVSESETFLLLAQTCAELAGICTQTSWTWPLVSLNISVLSCLLKYER